MAGGLRHVGRMAVRALTTPMALERGSQTNPVEPTRAAASEVEEIPKIRKGLLREC